MSISPEQLVAKVKAGDDLSGIEAPKLHLKKAELDGAKLSGADLSRAVLSRCSLKGADLSGAKLGSADLSGCDLTGANLDNADLSEANLRSAVLTNVSAAGAKFNDCYLTGARIDGLRAAGASFKGADLAKTKGDKLELTGAVLTDADASDVEWNQVALAKAEMSGAVLQNAHLTNAGLAQAKLEGADLGLATLTDCDLSGVDAGRADFGNALLERVDLRGAKLERATFAIAEFIDCKLEDVAVQRANFKSVSGLSEQFLNQLQERGATINMFLMRRAARFVYRSHVAKLVLLVVVCAVGFGAWHYLTSPTNWNFTTLMSRAQQAVANGEYEQAVKLYDVTIEKYPDTRKQARALLAKGQVLNQNGRYEQAQACFDRVKKEFAGYDDEVVGSLLGTGDNLLGRGRYDDSEKVYRELINDWPGYPQAIEAYIRIAKIYDLSGRSDEAKAIYDELQQRYGENEQARLRAMTEEANFHANRREYDKAIELNRKIAEQFKGKPPAVQARGRLVVLYTEIGKPEQAQKIADEIRNSKPADISSTISADLTLANYYSSVGRYDEAEQRFKQVIDKYPRRNDISWAREALAGLYANQGRFDLAQEQYQLLIEKFDDQPAIRDKARIDLAENVARSGDLERAEDLLKKAVDSGLAAVVQGRALLSLADLQIKLGRFDQARALYQRVIQNGEPEGRDASQARMGLARLEDTLGRPDEAIKLYNQIAAQTDDPAIFLDVQNQIAQIHLRDDANDSQGKAAAAYGAVIERFESSPDVVTSARMNLAELAKRRGDMEAAEQIYIELAQSPQPSKATGALNALLRLYSELDQIEKMDQVKQEIVRRFPADAAAQIDAELESANMLARKGNYPEALQAYRQVVQRVDGQRESVALEAMISVFTSMGDVAGAERGLADLRQRHPAEVMAISNAENAVAAAYRHNGRHAEAIALYEQIRARKTFLPDDVRMTAADNIAQTYVESGEFERAEQLYKQMLQSPELERNPLGRTTVRFGLGMLYENVGRRDEALAIYQQLVGDTTVNERGKADSIRALVRVYSAMGQVDQARQWVARYVEMFPNDRSAHLDCRVDLASALASQGRMPEALEIYREVAQRADDPRRKANALNAQAQILSNMGRHDEAAALFAKIVEDYPQLIGLVQNVEFALADISTRRSRYKDALARFRAILDRYDDEGVQVRALSAIADIHVSRGETALAEKTYRRLMDEFTNVDARVAGAMGLASLMRQRGEFDAALGLYQQALQIAPDQGTRNSLKTAIATTYGETGDRDRMVKVYAELAQSSPEGSQSWLNALFEQAQALRNLQKFDESIALYDKLVQRSLEPNNRSHALLSRSQALLEAGRLDQAKAAFELTIKEFPDNQGILDDARTGLASVSQSQGDLETAEALLNKIIETSQNSNQRNSARIALARMKMDQGQAQRAEQVLEQLLSNAPAGSPTAYSARMTLGEVYRRSGRGDKALTLYREMLRGEADGNRQIDLLNSIAGTQQGLGRSKDAIATYERLIERFADNAATRCSAQLGIAGIILADRDYEQAEEYYTKITQGGCDPNTTFWAWSSIAQIRSQTGRFDDAVEIYQKLGQLYPDNAQFLCDSKLNRANTLRFNRHYAEALGALEEVVKSCPGPQFALNALSGIAQIHMERNEFDKAKTAYERIGSEFPEDPRAKAEARMGLANLALMQGRWDEAISGFREIFEKGENRDQRQSAAINLGRVLRERGRLDEAERVYNSLARDFKNFPGAQVESQMGLGQVARERGDNRAAEQYLRQAQKVSPDPGRAGTALEILAGLYIDDGDWTKVDALLAEIAADYPSEFNPQLNIRLSAANGARAQDRTDLALRYLDGLITGWGDYPQAAWALHTKAQILSDEGKYAEAREIYNRIIKDYANNLSSVLDAHIGLGNVFMSEQKFPEAMAKYQYVADNWPGQPQAVSALFAISNLYQQLGNVEQHEAQLLKILAAHPDNPQAQADASQALGNLWWQQNRPSEAIAKYEVVVKFSPNRCQRAWAQSSIGRIFFQQGEIDESEKRFRDIVDNTPTGECDEVVQDAKQFLETLYQKP
ncbi:MAG: tetratricopeptide repeat protein [Candidatus Alcyoniella australis]|nr:tetratricopeptide repeat protein [Candidatus Alcyoniella australis]